jgi:predicted transcriptional regulator
MEASMAPSDTFHLFGPLEREIMTIMWDQQQATVRRVWRQILVTRPLAYTTVMTAMTRLTEKGLLTQERRGPTTEPRGFVYRPVVTRSALLEQAVGRLQDELGATDAERRHLAEALHG